MALLSALTKAVDELVQFGYPREVAERIVDGTLDMRTDAIIERQQDMFPTTAFHGGGDDIRVVDPNRVTSGKTANTGFFMSSSPVNAASYADRAGNIMPLAVDTRGFDVVNAGGNEWNRIVNPDYLLGGERLATFGELPGYRGTMEPDRGIFDLNVVRDFDTDELARTARRFKSPGLIVKDVQDIGPNYKAFDPAFEAMTGLKLGDEGYQEALDRFSADTIVASDPTRVRSLFAAFDPEYKGSNILGGAATAAVGAGLLASPEEAEAGPLSAAARAAQQGFTNKQYHASMQDFDRIVPGYDDGLFFTTPNPEFASNWAGKGKLQNREGELDSYDRYRPQKEKLYEEMGSPEFGTPEYDEFVKRSSEIYLQEQNAFKTVYPLLARTEKTFDPEKNFDDIADLFDEGRLNAPFSAEYPTYADALKGGNYILYENPEVVRHLKNKGYDSMFLRESTGSKEAREAPYTTVAHFYPDRNIRSQFAEFAEGYTGPNILGGSAAGALGLTALMAPEEAEAGVVKTFGRAFDPRFDPRVKEQEKLRDTTFTIEERGTQDAPRIPLADLEGRPFVTTMSDRTQAGGLLTGIDDVALDRPINLQGGQGFMFENPGMVWASAPGVVNQIMRAASEVGDNPVYLPFRMAPTGGDFATMTGETMLSFASSNMNKTQKKALDKAIKDYESVGSMVKGKRVGAGLKIKDWKGVDDPSSVEVWRNTPDTLRKELMNMMDVQFRDKGGLSVGQARLAVTEPGQADALDAQIQNIGEIFTNKDVVQASGHPSYPAGVPGQGLGRTDQEVGIFELLTDARFGGQQRPVGDPQKPTAQEIRALQMKPYTGRITEDILRGLEARGVNVNANPMVTAAAVAAGQEAEGLLAQLPQKDTEAYNYSDVLPIKRSKNPEEREGLLGGYSPAYTGIVEDMVEGLLKFSTQAKRGIYNPAAATEFLL